jgi:hypothetical protein
MINIPNPKIYPEKTGTNNAIADKMAVMKLNFRITIFNRRNFLVRNLWRLSYYITMLIVSDLSVSFADSNTPMPGKTSVPAKKTSTSQDQDTAISEYQPIAFGVSYIGISLNKNEPLADGTRTWSTGVASWGGEYRFFYKDQWTLALSTEFKGLKDLSGEDLSLFTASQETMRIVRIYHPFYLTLGGRLSYYVPVKHTAIPYERDPNRPLDTGGALSIGSIWIASPNVLMLLRSNRWMSFSSTKNQGVEFLATALFNIR